MAPPTIEQDPNRNEGDRGEGKEQLRVDFATKEDLLEEAEEVREKVTGRSLIKLPVEVGGIPVESIIDTGATHSCINVELYTRLVACKGVQGELPVTGLQLTTAVGKKKIRVTKQVWVHTVWESRGSDMRCLVVPGLFAQMLLGLDWLTTSRIVIDCAIGKLTCLAVGQEDSRTSSETNEKTEGVNTEKRGATISTVVAEEKREFSVQRISDLERKRLKPDRERRANLGRSECNIVLKGNVEKLSESDPRKYTRPVKDNTWTLKKERWKEKSGQKWV